MGKPTCLIYRQISPLRGVGRHRELWLELPGTLCGVSALWYLNRCLYSGSAQSFGFNVSVNYACGFFFSNQHDLLAGTELPVQCCQCFAALQQRPNALHPPQGAHFNMENPEWGKTNRDAAQAAKIQLSGAAQALQSVSPSRQYHEPGVRQHLQQG